MLFWKGAGLAGRGKVKESRAVLGKARAELLAAGVKDFAAVTLALEVDIDGLAGYAGEAREKAGETIQMSEARGPRSFAAEQLALNGDVAKATEIMNGLSQKFPQDEHLRVLNQPMVAAAVALQKNKPEEAVADLEPVRPYELGSGPNAVGFGGNYLRGQAYLKLRDGQKAAAEFQRILDHRGVNAWDPEYPLSHLQLARAYVLEGDAGKARTAYQDFFAAWKDADADLPVLRDAKAEYEKVK
jgi:predicted Zn-dependent protease